MGTIVRLGRQKSPPSKERSIDDKIPDRPENRALREFLTAAPPGAVPLKPNTLEVAQCFKCKQFGHRANSRDCPLFKSGNIAHEQKLQHLEDPMAEWDVEPAKEESSEDLSKLKAFIEQELRQKEKDKDDKSGRHKGHEPHRHSADHYRESFRGKRRSRYREGHKRDSRHR
ncbi:hypothetical protein P9112_012972 [Eukaryota sp. TZLM1-RC]